MGSLGDLTILNDGVLHVLSQLGDNGAMGPDGIHPLPISVPTPHPPASQAFTYNLH